MVKKVLLFFLLFLLGGCGTSSYYILSTVPETTNTYKRFHGSIGVEKITVPKYLFRREIAVAKSASQVTFLHGARWAEDIDEGLTRRLIGFLQKKFNQANIYNYPWGVEVQPRLKVNVQIVHFIAQNSRVYLDASIRLEMIGGEKQKAKLFSRSIPIVHNDASNIVIAMDRIFGLLEEEIALDIREF